MHTCVGESSGSAICFGQVRLSDRSFTVAAAWHLFCCVFGGAWSLSFPIIEEKNAIASSTLSRNLFEAELARVANAALTRDRWDGMVSQHFTDAMDRELSSK